MRGMLRQLARKTGMLLAPAIFLLLPVPAASQQTAAPGNDPLPMLFVEADRCLACHNGLMTPNLEEVSIGSDWQGSIMAHSSQDPYWQASVRREIMDHPQSRASIEDECSACHMPMTRYHAKIRGSKGRVFAHLPLAPAAGRPGRLAADGVSCSICHQIEAHNLGTEDSYTAGFEVDTSTPAGERPLYGPYQVDQGRRTIMQSAAEVFPTQSTHVQKSELCATCHTLYTRTRGLDGEIIGTLPEQVPYLEWLHSAYRDQQSCQACHLPVVEQPMAVTSVSGQDREGFSRHVFRGGNFFMQKMLARLGPESGVTTPPRRLTDAAAKTEAHLQTQAAQLTIEKVERSGGRLTARVALTNLAGHKLPTAYPSRRAWIHFTIKDRDGRTLFESGRLQASGAIAENDNDLDPAAYEPHYSRIDREEQVQIYETIMVTPAGETTTGLLSASRFTKDNRLLPHGFDKEGALPDIAVQGRAATDVDFSDGGDRIQYSAAIGAAKGPFKVQAALWYQPIAFRWARNLRQVEAVETSRFIAAYQAMSEHSALVLARDTRTVE